jgi:hypothetical protein
LQEYHHTVESFVPHLCFSAQMFGPHAGASGDKDHEAVVGMINQNMQENWVSTVVQRRKFQ